MALLQVRETVPVALLSNATDRLEQDLTALGIDGDFDHVLNSSRLGIAKPDPETFRIASLRLGLPVSECLFVDDTLSHVAAAHEVGLRVHHYRCAEELRNDLRSVGFRLE